MPANAHVPGIPPALYNLTEHQLCAYYNAIDARYAVLTGQRDTPRPATETPGAARAPDVPAQHTSATARPL